MVSYKKYLVLQLIILVLMLLMSCKPKHSNEYIYDNGYTYYYDDKGNLLKNQWKEYISGKWYYFDEQGRMIIANWLNDNDNWYYFDENGTLVVNNWIDDNGKYYYAGQGGAIIKSSEKVIDGKTYVFDENGVASEKKKQVAQSSTKNSNNVGYLNGNLNFKDDYALSLKGSYTKLYELAMQYINNIGTESENQLSSKQSEINRWYSTCYDRTNALLNYLDNYTDTYLRLSKYDANNEGAIMYKKKMDNLANDLLQIQDLMNGCKRLFSFINGPYVYLY